MKEQERNEEIGTTDIQEINAPEYDEISLGNSDSGETKQNEVD